jgi:hypothetical protein
MKGNQNHFQFSTMKKVSALSTRYLNICGLVILMISLISCNSQSVVTASPIPALVSNQVGGNETLEQLIDHLTLTGTFVEVGGDIQQPFFLAQGKLLRVDDEEIQVYIYPDFATRRAASDSISSDGTVIGQTNITWINTPFIWASEDLIVFYLGSDPELVAVISGYLGEPLAKPETTPQEVEPDQDYPLAVFEAVKDLSIRQNLSADQIAVISFERQVWPDSCLGLADPGEMCKQALTSGYKIILSILDKDFIYHTDEIGYSVRSANRRIP